MLTVDQAGFADVSNQTRQRLGERAKDPRTLISAVFDADFTTAYFGTTYLPVISDYSAASM